MSVISYAEPFCRKHGFPVILHLLSFLFMSLEKPRSFSILQCATKACDRYATCVVFYLGSVSCRQFICLETRYLLSQDKTSREEVKESARRFFTMRLGSRQVSFISSRERRILDFEIYVTKFVGTNFLFAEASAVAENKDTLNMSLHYYIVFLTYEN